MTLLTDNVSGCLTVSDMLLYLEMCPEVHHNCSTFELSILSLMSEEKGLFTPKISSPLQSDVAASRIVCIVYVSNGS